jgi:hypothetical protein
MVNPRSSMLFHLLYKKFSFATVEQLDELIDWYLGYRQQLPVWVYGVDDYRKDSSSL